MTKSTAKAKVLEVHKHAYCCRVFGMLQGHPTLRTTAYFGVFKTARSTSLIATGYFGVFKTARSTSPIATGLTQSAAWKAAAANLKKGTK